MYKITVQPSIILEHLPFEYNLFYDKISCSMRHINPDNATWVNSSMPTVKSIHPNGPWCISTNNNLFCNGVMLGPPTCKTIIDVSPNGKLCMIQCLDNTFMIVCYPDSKDLLLDLRPLAFVSDTMYVCETAEGYLQTRIINSSLRKIFSKGEKYDSISVCDQRYLLMRKDGTKIYDLIFGENIISGYQKHVILYYNHTYTIYMDERQHLFVNSTDLGRCYGIMQIDFPIIICILELPGNVGHDQLHDYFHSQPIIFQHSNIQNDQNTF